MIILMLTAEAAVEVLLNTVRFYLSSSYSFKISACSLIITATIKYQRMEISKMLFKLHQHLFETVSTLLW